MDTAADLSADPRTQGRRPGCLRRHGDARQRITSGWQAVHALAGQSGIPVTGTRRDQAQAIARQLNIDGAPLIALGRQADYAAFSGQPVTPEQAVAYWRSVLTTRKLMLASQSFMRRLRTRLSLRGVFHNVRILSSIRTWRHGDKREARRTATRQTAPRQAEILHETARWPEARHATTIRTATLLAERPTVMNDMQIHVAADSNIGLRRRANQDSFIIDDGVFLVCDGMGGGVGGQQPAAPRWIVSRHWRHVSAGAARPSGIRSTSPNPTCSPSARSSVACPAPR